MQTCRGSGFEEEFLSLWQELDERFTLGTHGNVVTPDDSLSGHAAGQMWPLRSANQAGLSDPELPP